MKAVSIMMLVRYLCLGVASMAAAAPGAAAAAAARVAAHSGSPRADNCGCVDDLEAAAGLGLPPDKCGCFAHDGGGLRCFVRDSTCASPELDEFTGVRRPVPTGGGWSAVRRGACAIACARRRLQLC